MMNLCHFYVIRIWNLFPFIRFIIPFSAPHFSGETKRLNVMIRKMEMNSWGITPI